jgi:ribosomal protein L30/L7E
MAVALVIRLSKKNDSLSPQSRAVLAELRLAEQFDGVLVPLTEDMRHKLRCISHLIAYGLPSPEVVRQLIHTRARTVADGSELLITGNKAIRDALGEFDIEGLSDIVHAISGGAGPDALAEICAFLAPFHFNPKEIQGARLPVYAGGPSGFRGEHIDAFVESIL